MQCIICRFCHQLMIDTGFQCLKLLMKEYKMYFYLFRYTRVNIEFDHASSISVSPDSRYCSFWEYLI